MSIIKRMKHPKTPNDFRKIKSQSKSTRELICWSPSVNEGNAHKGRRNNLNVTKIIINGNSMKFNYWKSGIAFQPCFNRSIYKNKIIKHANTASALLRMPAPTQMIPSIMLCLSHWPVTQKYIVSGEKCCRNSSHLWQLGQIFNCKNQETRADDATDNLRASLGSENQTGEAENRTDSVGKTLSSNASCYDTYIIFANSMAACAETNTLFPTGELFFWLLNLDWYTLRMAQKIWHKYDFIHCVQSSPLHLRVYYRKMFSEQLTILYWCPYTSKCIESTAPLHQPYMEVDRFFYGVHQCMFHTCVMWKSTLQIYLVYFYYNSHINLVLGQSSYRHSFI